MLLKLLHDFAISRNLLEDPAFVKKPVRWIIRLGADGRLIGEGPIETAGEEAKKGREFFKCFATNCFVIVNCAPFDIWEGWRWRGWHRSGWTQANKLV